MELGKQSQNCEIWTQNSEKKVRIVRIFEYLWNWVKKSQNWTQNSDFMVVSISYLLTSNQHIIKKTMLGRYKLHYVGNEHTHTPFTALQNDGDTHTSSNLNIKVSLLLFKTSWLYYISLQDIDSS